MFSYRDCFVSGILNWAWLKLAMHSGNTSSWEASGYIALYESTIRPLADGFVQWTLKYVFFHLQEHWALYCLLISSLPEWAACDDKTHLAPVVVETIRPREALLLLDCSWKFNLNWAIDLSMAACLCTKAHARSW